MPRLPNKTYQRLCSQYATAMRRAIRLEIMLSELVDAQLTDEQRQRRDVFQCSNDAMYVNTPMKSFLVPLGAELDRWRDKEGGTP